MMIMLKKSKKLWRCGPDHDDYEIFEKSSSYFFNFNNDTLTAVYRGKWNSVWEKEIDYSKYASPPE